MGHGNFEEIRPSMVPRQRTSGLDFPVSELRGSRALYLFARHRSECSRRAKPSWRHLRGALRGDAPWVHPRRWSPYRSSTLLHLARGHIFPLLNSRNQHQNRSQMRKSWSGMYVRSPGEGEHCSQSLAPRSSNCARNSRVLSSPFSSLRYTSLCTRLINCLCDTPSSCTKFDSAGNSSALERLRSHEMLHLLVRRLEWSDHFSKITDFALDVLSWFGK